MLGIDTAEVSSHRAPWNKGRLIGQKRPLKPKEVWAIRVRLQLEERRRDLALFNLALDSKLRGCDLVRLQVSDVCVGGRVRDRATVIERKPANRSSLKSPNKPEPQSAIGSPIAFQGTGSTSSRAAFMTSRTSRHDNTRGSSTIGSSAQVSTARLTGPTQCGGPRPRRFTRRRAICGRFSCCSVTRHTAREHSTEAKVHYPYHPQFGEAVIVKRRLVTHNVEMAVILQPDGSLACLPAWMLAESAAQHRVCQSPTISLAFLQSLRVEIDGLLASLPSDSEMGDERHAAKFQNARKQATRAVRANPARNRGDTGPATTAGDAGRSPAERDRLGARNRGGRQ